MVSKFKEQIVGTWELVEYSRDNPDGGRSYPLGEDATGFLLYTQDGYMSAQLMAPERKGYSLSELHSGTTEEMAGAARGYHAYSGKYEVDEEEKTLYHHMEVSMIPNRIGQVQDRMVEVDGDQITITSSLTPSRIIWKKAANNAENSKE